MEPLEGDGVIIKVNMQDVFASSTMLKATSKTKASELCAVIAHKLALKPNEVPYHNLVLVHTIVAHSGRKHHTIKTLKHEEFVLEILKNVKEKQHERHNVNQQKLEFYSTWYYKDSLSHPLDTEYNNEDAVSGNESSDDEEEISLSDVSYLRQNDRKGFMLKKSMKDPNLWRRRYCILTDKLWCVDAKKTIPRATCINIGNKTKLLDNNTVEVPFSFGLINSSAIPPSTILTKNTTANNSTPRGRGSKSQSSSVAPTSVDPSKSIHKPHRNFYFRLQSEVSMSSWMDEIRQRAAMNNENEVISLAEQIICDEECNRNARMHKLISPFTEMYVNTFQSNYIEAINSNPANGMKLQHAGSLTPRAVTTAIQNHMRNGSNRSNSNNSAASSVAAVGESQSLSSAVKASPSIRKIQQNKQHLARNYSFSTGSLNQKDGNSRQTDIYCVPSSSRYNNRIPCYIHRFHHTYALQSDILAFIVCVGKFKEILRPDLQYSVEEQWERVCNIYNDFIAYQLLFGNKEKSKSSINEGGSESQDTVNEGGTLSSLTSMTSMNSTSSLASYGYGVDEEVKSSLLLWDLSEAVETGPDAGKAVRNEAWVHPLDELLKVIMSNLKLLNGTQKVLTVSKSGKASGKYGSSSSSKSKSSSNYVIRYHHQPEHVIHRANQSVHGQTVMVTDRYRTEDLGTLEEEAAAAAAASGGYWLWPSVTTPPPPKTTSANPTKRTQSPLSNRPAATVEGYIPEYICLLDTDYATHELIDPILSPPITLFDRIVRILRENVSSSSNDRRTVISGNRDRFPSLSANTVTEGDDEEDEEYGDHYTSSRQNSEDQTQSVLHVSTPLRPELMTIPDQHEGILCSKMSTPVPPPRPL